MTVTVMSEKSTDGKVVCALEFDKYCPYKAVVYEKDYYSPTHQSVPTWDKDKAVKAYKRFVNKYIKERKN